LGGGGAWIDSPTMGSHGRLRRSALILYLAGCSASGAPPSSPEVLGTPRALSWDECGSLALEFDPATESHPGVLGVAVSPDRCTLVATTLLTAQAWRVADDLAASAHAWTVRGNEVYAEFSPDGSLVAISGDGRALVDFASGAEVFVPALPPSTVPDLEYPGAFMAFFDFSRDGRLVAGSGYDFAVEVFDTATHARLAALPSGSLDTGAAFSPDGTLVATGIPELYRTSDWARLWPATLTREATTVAGLEGYPHPLDSVVFTPDGEQLVVSKCFGGLDRDERCTNSLFAVADGRALGDLPLTGSRPVFSRDGTMLIAGGDVWTPATGRVQHLGDFSAGVFASNDDVFVGTNDGAVKRLCVRP
jgi:WD40 repeat protein